MDWSLLITIALWVLAAALVVIGLAGLALPALPGAPVLFGGLLVAAWAEDFQYLGWGGIIALGVLALLTYPVDFVAGALGAKKFGASSRAIAGAAVGGLVGLFFGPLGILVGPFIGAAIGEISQQRKLHEAGMSGIGATIGLIVGTVAKLAIAVSMIGLFFVLRFNG